MLKSKAPQVLQRLLLLYNTGDMINYNNIKNSMYGALGGDKSLVWAPPTNICYIRHRHRRRQACHEHINININSRTITVCQLIRTQKWQRKAPRHLLAARRTKVNWRLKAIREWKQRRTIQQVQISDPKWSLNQQTDSSKPGALKPNSSSSTCEHSGRTWYDWWSTHDTTQQLKSSQSCLRDRRSSRQITSLTCGSTVVPLIPEQTDWVWEKEGKEEVTWRTEMAEDEKQPLAAPSSSSFGN